MQKVQEAALLGTAGSDLWVYATCSMGKLEIRKKLLVYKDVKH